MCPKPKISQPKIEPTAQAPAPAQPAATVNQSGPKAPEEVSPEAAGLKARKKGRSGLRINLDAGTGSRSTGLNIPQA